MKQSKVLAVLCYLNFLVIIPLIWGEDDQLVKVHLKQGLLLSLGFIVLPFALIIPLLGWIIGGVLAVLLVVLWVMGIISALNGQHRNLPIIGKPLAKIAI